MEVESSNSATKTAQNLLSLPDGPLFKILEFVGSSWALGPSWRPVKVFSPRFAFSLALANTRLLQLYRQMLTTVGQDLHRSNLSTSNPSHILAVARLAGEHLRVLHLPRGASVILADISKLCPNVRLLSVVEGDHREMDGLSDVLRLPISKVAISHVSRHTLSLINVVPKALCLTDMNERCFEELARILKRPPKRLCLGFVFPQGYHDFFPDFKRMMEVIREACPKTEYLEVSTTPNIIWGWQFACIEELARSSVRSVRRNQNARNSLCKSVSLSGRDTFPILEAVHPEADISIISDHIEFCDEGDGTYLRCVVLRHEFLELDLSRLASVISLEEEYNPRWKNLLSELPLERAWVRNIQQAADLSLKVSLLTIIDPIEVQELGPSTQWTWLSKLRRLALKPPVVSSSCAKLTKYFDLLINIVENFDGVVIVIDDIKRVEIEDEADLGLLTTALKLNEALTGLEERGCRGEYVSLLLTRMIDDTIIPSLINAGFATAFPS